MTPPKVEEEVKGEKPVVTIDSEAQKTKDNHYGRSIQQLSESYFQFGQHGDGTLVSERDAFLAKQNELMQKIAQKEQELRLQSAQSGNENLARMNIETELAALKINYDTAKQTWSERYKHLTSVHAKEQERAKLDLEKVKEQAQREIKEATAEVQKHKLALKAGIDEKEAQSQTALAELRAEFQRYKEKSQDALLKEKEAAKMKQVELNTVIKQKTKELQEQKSLTATQTAKTDELWKRRCELEVKLTTLQTKYSSEMSDWERRYQEKQDLYKREQQNQRELFEQKETELRKRLDAIAHQAALDKSALENEMESMAEECDLALRELRDAAAKKENEMNIKLKSVQKELEASKFEAHKALMLRGRRR